VFAAFTELRVGSDDEPAEIPVGPADSLGHEWAVIVDAPGYAACLVGWETPEPGRVFEALWTLEPTVVRRAAQIGAALAARTAPAWSERLLGLLADRPLAVEQPAPGLTALTNRMISYLDVEADRPLPLPCWATPSSGWIRCVGSASCVLRGCSSRWRRSAR